MSDGDNKRVLLGLISGAEASTEAGIVAMFTAIRRRAPTEAELAEFRAQQAAKPATSVRHDLTETRWGKRAQDDGAGVGLVGDKLSTPPKPDDKP